MDVGLAAFDMDGTLTQGRLVFALADKFGLAEKIKDIQASGQEGHLQTKEIAALFSGIAKSDLVNAVESIPLTKNCEKAVAVFKEKNYKLGIISDSYTLAAEMVADRLGMDFVAANQLEIVDSKITGRVHMPLGWEKIGCFCKISVCKRYHLEQQALRFGVPMEKTMAIGDTKSDLCMIQRAGVGISFMPKDSVIAKASKNVVREPDMLIVSQFAA
ncbi:MAG TPA: HAD-IB family phosphatase [Nitrososphaera sp.]|jgi:phosphoserine phosphatase|nr:HAD-IB family phosphatase [Nitrososphaera sp.]